jgi:hypothetical protein
LNSLPALSVLLSSLPEYSPDGQKVMDAFVAYLKAQDDYVQAIIKPMSKFPTWYFNKADTSILDELAIKANDKLSSLEEEIRIFVNLPRMSSIFPGETASLLCSGFFASMPLEYDRLSPYPANNLTIPCRAGSLRETPKSA